MRLLQLYQSRKIKEIMDQKNQREPFLIMDKNENRINIHPELRIIFNFLIQIETEVRELLGYKNRLEALKKQCSELLELMIKMSSADDFKFTLSEHPETITDKLNFVRPIRSEFIVLFAHLETLRCLYMAYKKNTSNSKELRNASVGAMDEFIKEFCLCRDNQWVLDNPKRAGKISAENLRVLRNSLTHFFSVNNIGLVPLYDEEAEQISNKSNNKVQLLSPEDFEKILYHAARLLLEKWSDDCKKSLAGESNNFVEKMRCVRDVVNKAGAIFIYDKDIKKIMEKIKK